LKTFEELSAGSSGARNSLKRRRAHYEDFAAGSGPLSEQRKSFARCAARKNDIATVVGHIEARFGEHGAANSAAGRARLRHAASGLAGSSARLKAVQKAAEGWNWDQALL